MSTELKYKVMDDEVRMEIARLYKDGWKVGDIADAVGLHETSVYRELNRGWMRTADSSTTSTRHGWTLPARERTRASSKA